MQNSTQGLAAAMSIQRENSIPAQKLPGEYQPSTTLSSIN
jgi:hypothetical protein